MTKNEQKLNNLRQWCVRRGYTLDRWGNYVRDVTQTRFVGGAPAQQITFKVRYVFTAHSIRRERQIRVSSGLHVSGFVNHWIRVSSAYLRDVTINADDKICGLNREGCKPQPPR